MRSLTGSPFPPRLVVLDFTAIQENSASYPQGPKPSFVNQASDCLGRDITNPGRFRLWNPFVRNQIFFRQNGWMFNPFSFILRHGALHYPVLDCV